jgi:predicted ATP-grasp superfamily ATP-dependent carboligase
MRLAVAALSARALAEAAAREGARVIALDVFGDADTRRAAQCWHAIGDADGLRIDGSRLLDALQRIAREDAAQGWVAGSGFEGRPDLLAAGHECLPLVGNGAAVVQRVRDPRLFFDVLRAHGIAHPPVRFDPPADPGGWLLKDFAGAGGWQVRPAGSARALGASQYLQAQRSGVPMSATFIADGRDARLLGCNRQLVCALGDAPFVWRGVIGPLPVSDAVRTQVVAALRACVREFALRGLGSLDFLSTAPDRIEVLELNPRWPASAEVLGAAGLPVLRMHVQACERAALPLPLPRPGSPRGLAVLYTPQAMHLSDEAAAWLGTQADVHDVPGQGGRVGQHAPLCSVVAAGRDADAVKEQLARRCGELLAALETFG